MCIENGFILFLKVCGSNIKLHNLMPEQPKNKIDYELIVDYLFIILSRIFHSFIPSKHIIRVFEI